MKNLTEIAAEIKMLERAKINFEVVSANCGVKLAEKVDLPYLQSGYAMGEEFRFVAPDGATFGYVDNRMQYARSCKYTPTHGNVRAKFETKKAMKEFFELCVEHDQLTSAKSWIPLRANFGDNEEQYQKMKRLSDSQIKHKWERVRYIEKRLAELVSVNGMKSSKEPIMFRFA